MQLLLMKPNSTPFENRRNNTLSINTENYHLISYEYDYTLRSDATIIYLYWLLKPTCFLLFDF